jgi:TolB protein
LAARRITLCFAVLAALAFAAPAHAAFPGKNGKLGFSTFVNGGSYEVFSMNPDGTGAVNLSQNPISDLEPSWSADGSRLLFTRGFFSDYEVWSMNADGTDQRDLSNDPHADINPAWSPDGAIVFSSDRDISSDFTSNFDIWLMNSDGSDQRQLTSNSGADVQDGQVAWSPDGRQIAFAHGVREGHRISVIDVATKATEVLTGGPGDDTEPNWSPDGRKLAFASTRTGAGDIYAMDADGSGLVRLTDSERRDRDPVWSPDGTKIAFIGARTDFDNAGGDIWVMNADGSQPTNLTSSQTRLHYQVDWQPIPGPKRSDYKNAAQFCKAEREFLGDAAFTKKYGSGANAYGKCVSGNH